MAPMTRSAEYRQVLDALSRCAQAESPEELIDTVLLVLVDLLHADEAAYAEMVGGRTGLTVAYPKPVMAYPLEILTVWRQRFTEHPLTVPALNGHDSAVRLSDLSPASTFRGSAFFADFFRPRGLRHGVYAVVERSGDKVAMIGGLRSGRDFSERERMVLELFRVPLAGLWRQVKARAELTRQLGRESGDPPTIYAPGLTRSEARVAALVGAGLTNKAVASSLNVTVKAVEQHLTRVYRKLAVSSRTELALRMRC